MQGSRTRWSNGPRLPRPGRPRVVTADASLGAHQEEQWMVRYHPGNRHAEKADHKPPPTEPAPIDQGHGEQRKPERDSLDEVNESCCWISLDPDERDEEE